MHNLKDYIDEYYSGNRAKWAKAFNKYPQNAKKYIDDGYCVIVDGDEHELMYESKEGSTRTFAGKIYHVTGKRL
jgi:hypothetical protein